MITLLDDVDYRIDGNIVRITATSGGTKIESAMPIAAFERTFRRAGQAIGDWHDERGSVVPIRRKRPKG